MTSFFQILLIMPEEKNFPKKLMREARERRSRLNPEESVALVSYMIKLRFPSSGFFFSTASLLQRDVECMVQHRTVGVQAEKPELFFIEPVDIETSSTEQEEPLECVRTVKKKRSKKSVKTESTRDHTEKLDMPG